MSKQYRYYKDLKLLFKDFPVLEDDAVIYEFDNIVPNTTDSDLLYGITTIYPGKVNNEFYMTRGHFHTPAISEVYYCISGDGIIQTQDLEGTSETKLINAGSIVYINATEAHRAINIGTVPLQLLCVCRADYQSDYNVCFNNRVLDLRVHI